MSKVPTVTSKRLIGSIPKFKKILNNALERDVNESDTVTIVTDMLEEIFGFDKYSEITKEYQIQGTYCDLAIKTGQKIEYFIEVKAIGIELKGNHLKQAVNYAARGGIKWVVLTNGLIWEIHKVNVDGKVENEKLFEINFDEINPRNREHQEILFRLCKRGVQKDLIDDFYERKQLVNPYKIGALILSEPVLNCIRKELKKLNNSIKADVDEVKEVIEHEIIKRELLETETGKNAKAEIDKLMRQQKRAKSKAETQAKARKPSEPVKNLNEPASQETLKDEEENDVNKSMGEH